MTKPLKWNPITELSLPIAVLQATTAEDQLDEVYRIADDPRTDQDWAQMLLRLTRPLLRAIEDGDASAVM